MPSFEFDLKTVGENEMEFMFFMDIHVLVIHTDIFIYNECVKKFEIGLKSEKKIHSSKPPILGGISMLFCQSHFTLLE